jgi:hypothetical protein
MVKCGFAFLFVGPETGGLWHLGHIMDEGQCYYLPKI